MDREIYALKVYSTRMEYDSFQLELTPKENEEANDYYGMIFNVTVWCRGQMCAKLWGKLYDENLVYSCGMDILNAADPFGREPSTNPRNCAFGRRSGKIYRAFQVISRACLSCRSTGGGGSRAIF